MNASYTILYGMISTICRPDTRGTLFFFAAMVKATALLAIQGLGGYLYGNLNKQDPFILGFAIWVAFTFISLMMGVKGKLN